MDKPKLRKTTDYSKFETIKSNRPVNLNTTGARKLEKSMQKYGWLPSMPMKIRRNGDGKYYIDDGQHRLAIADKFGLVVWYVIDNVVVNLPELQEARGSWSLEDHLSSYVEQGYDDYSYLSHFYNRYDMPLSACVTLLGGRTYYHGDNFKSGNFEISDKGRANEIAQAYTRIIKLQDKAKGGRFVFALIACYEVEEFDLDYLVNGCEKNINMLIKCGDTDSFIDMIDQIYNYRNQNKIPLEFLAKEQLRKGK